MSGGAKAVKFFTVPKASASPAAFSAEDFLAELREMEDDIELPQEKVDQLHTLNKAANEKVTQEPAAATVYEIPSDSEADTVTAETELKPGKRDFLDQIKDQKHFLDAKAAEEYQEYLEDTTLAGMVFRNQLDIMERHLMSGFDPNSLDHRGEHPTLHHAAYQSNIAAIKCLLKYNANLNIANSRGETALMWAVKKDDIDIIRFLVKNGADINASDTNGLTAFLHAAECGKEVNMAYLVHGCGVDINSRDRKGKNALHWSSYRGHIGATRWLLHHGCNRMVADDVNNLPIHWAVLKCHMEATELLLSYQPAVHLASADACFLPAMDTASYRQIPNLVFEQCFHVNADGFTVRQALVDRESRPESMDNSEAFYAPQVRRYLTGEICGAYVNYYTCYLGTSLYYLLDYLGGAFGLAFMSSMVYSIFSLNMYLDMFLGPYAYLQYIYYLLTVGGVISWILVIFTNPGHIHPNMPSDEYNPDSPTYEEMYKKALVNTPEENLAMFETTVPNICTTCRILRPIRSKHCSSCNRCVHKFDHHCPFLSTDIGANNYSAFFYYCMCNSLGIGLFLVMYCIAMARANFTYQQLFGEMKLLTITHLWFIMCFLLSTAMFLQHIPFSLENITTNESINKKKYAYLSKDGKFFNPFASTALTNCTNVVACLPTERMVVYPSKIYMAKESTENNLKNIHVTKSRGNSKKEWTKLRTFYDTDDEVV